MTPPDAAECEPASTERTVTFELKPDDFALWDLQMKRVVEPGTFTIYAGPNSVDLKEAKLTVTG